MKNAQIKGSLEELEQYSLNTSEQINEQIEGFQRRLVDLDSELAQNLQLILEKRQVGSADVEEFISDLCEDVREFLMYLRQEIEEVEDQVKSRDSRCQEQMAQIYTQITDQIQAKKRATKDLDAKEA